MAANGLSKEECFKPKLTAAQRNEIFDAWVNLPFNETWGFVKRTAEQYGVCKETIGRIIHDKKRMQRYLDKMNEIRNLSLIRLINATPQAVDVAVSIMNDSTLPEHMAATRLNAAETVMRRAGIQHKEAEENNTVKIQFTGSGFAVGSPAPTEDE